MYQRPITYLWYGICFLLKTLTASYHVTSKHLFARVLIILNAWQGDFVDRGYNSLEVFTILLLLKARYAPYLCTCFYLTFVVACMLTLLHHVYFMSLYVYYLYSSCGWFLINEILPQAFVEWFTFVKSQFNFICLFLCVWILAFEVSWIKMILLFLFFQTLFPMSHARKQIYGCPMHFYKPLPWNHVKIINLGVMIVPPLFLV